MDIGIDSKLHIGQCTSTTVVVSYAPTPSRSQGFPLNAFQARSVNRDTHFPCRAVSELRTNLIALYDPLVNGHDGFVPLCRSVFAGGLVRVFRIILDPLDAFFEFDHTSAQ